MLISAQEQCNKELHYAHLVSCIFKIIAHQQDTAVWCHRNDKVYTLNHKLMVQTAIPFYLHLSPLGTSSSMNSALPYWVGGQDASSIRALLISVASTVGHHLFEKGLEPVQVASIQLQEVLAALQRILAVACLIERMKSSSTIRTHVYSISWRKIEGNDF